ncbi:hypothetical protein CR513_38949, partial [Mucuna pruriens]
RSTEKKCKSKSIRELEERLLLPSECNQLSHINEHTSGSCSKSGFTLGLDGALIVQLSDIDHFCKDGCKQHTLSVLDCIDDVKSNFFFQTKQPVTYIRDVTTIACINHTGTLTTLTLNATHN